MDIHGKSGHAIAIASCTIIAALLKHLEIKSIIVRDDARDILTSAANEIAGFTALNEAKNAGAIVTAMLADFPEHRP